MEKPTNFHLAIMFFEALRKKHEMIIMAPDNITFFVMLIYNISKHLVCLLVGSELRLETASGGKAVFLWKSQIMEKRPQYVVTVAIIILVHSFFIKEHRYAPLQSVQQVSK